MNVKSRKKVLKDAEMDDGSQKKLTEKKSKNKGTVFKHCDDQTKGN
jgi:hypothetical protein